MKSYKKFTSTFLIASLVVAPISGVVVHNDNVARADGLNFNEVDEAKDTIIGPEMTREELIKYYAKNHNISYDQAESELFKSKIESMVAYKYRTIAKNLQHGAKIEFYTQGDGWGNYYAIHKVLNVSVKHSNKSFVGVVYTNLEINTVIYYDVEGNLHDNGTTSVSGGLNIGVGQGASLNLGASYSSNIYKHISVSERSSIY